MEGAIKALCTSSTSDDEMEISGVAITDHVMRSLRVAKNYKDSVEPVNSLDFNSTGERLISASDDGWITIYNCLTGE